MVISGEETSVFGSHRHGVDRQLDVVPADDGDDLQQRAVASRSEIEDEVVVGWSTAIALRTAWSMSTASTPCLSAELWMSTPSNRTTKHRAIATSQHWRFVEKVGVTEAVIPRRRRRRDRVPDRLLRRVDTPQLGPGGKVRLLLTSGGVTNASIRDALVDLLGKPIADVHCAVHPDGAVGSPDVRARLGAGLRRRRAPAAHVQPGLGVGGRPGAHRTAQHRRGALGAVGPGGRRPARGRRRRDVPVPLDAEVRAGGPPAVAARDRLGRGERREHGDDAPHR